MKHTGVDALVNRPKGQTPIVEPKYKLGIEMSGEHFALDIKVSGPHWVVEKILQEFINGLKDLS